MKEIVISVIIILIIVFSDMWVGNFVDEKINHMISLLEEASPLLADENYEEANSKIDEVSEYLKESEVALSCYIEHNELEKVQNSLTNIKAYIKMESDDAYSEAESMAFILKHIESKDDLKIENIF